MMIAAISLAVLGCLILLLAGILTPPNLKDILLLAEVVVFGMAFVISGVWLVIRSEHPDIQKQRRGK